MSVNNNGLELQTEVVNQVYNFSIANKCSHLIIALSGGLDSVVLLDILKKGLINEKYLNLLAVHVDHGINESSTTWATFCKNLCDKHDIAYQQFDLNLKSIKSNKEHHYRQARYKIFAKLMKESTILITAHHQNDQMETVLYNLFRGTGTSGLKGMRHSREFADGIHLRPLLAYRKEALQQYAEQCKLKWIEDPSNSNSELDRNYIRHELIPMITTRWPKAVKSVSRMTELIAQDEEVLFKHAKRDIENCTVTSYGSIFPNAYISVLSIAKIRQLSSGEQQNLLMYWVKTNCNTTLNNKHIKQLLNNIVEHNKSDNSLFQLNHCQIRSDRAHLYLLPSTFFQNLNHSNISLDYQHAGNVYSIPELNIKIESSILTKLLIDNAKQEITLQFKIKQGGETIKLNGINQKVKKVYQQHNVPKWERKFIPLIYLNDNLIAIPGIAINDELNAKNCKIPLISRS